jgi:RimJ/RimL family protein N-acetyltransferase
VTDKASLLRHANSRQIWRNLTHLFPHPYTEADADDWLSVSNQLAPSLHLAIEYEHEAVGGIGILAGEGISAHVGRLGYWLGEQYWGRGIATAAAQAMIRHAFTGSLFLRLEAQVFEWNPSSMRVLEKVGFVREAVLKHSVQKDGELIDSVLFALVRSA